MVGLIDTLKAELQKYAGEGANCMGYTLFDDVQQHYALVILDAPIRRDPADLLIFVRVVDGKIVIEEDMTDKKLVDALLQQDIPRHQIILAYDLPQPTD